MILSQIRSPFHYELRVSSIDGRIYCLFNKDAPVYIPRASSYPPSFPDKSEHRDLTGSVLRDTENAGGTHTPADTHRYHAVSVILPPHFVHQTYGELRTCATEGMS